MKKGKTWYVFRVDGDDCVGVDCAVTSMKYVPDHVEEVLECTVTHVHRRESSWTTVE